MSCKHADEFFTQKTNALAYKTIVNHVTFPRTEKGLSKKASVQCLYCVQSNLSSTCKNSTESRPTCLLACAHCVSFCCWGNHHVHTHWNEAPSHFICERLPRTRGTLLCWMSGFCLSSYYGSFYRISPTNVPNSICDCRMCFLLFQGLSNQSWRPSFEELKLFPHITSIAPPCTTLGGRPTRGLINMGNTCFLNVVIQALTHTPVLRDFLLADLHRCDNPARSRSCLACEMIRVTQEIYSPALTPFVPSNLLYAIWLHASHLAGYEQRDAHEFLITLLTLIHGHLVGERAPFSETASEPCFPTKRRHMGSDRLSDDSNGSDDLKQLPLVPDHPSRGPRAPSLNGTTALPEAKRSPRASSESHTPTVDSASSQTSASSSRDSSGESCDCIVHQVFFGDLESVISYEGCGHSSSTVDPFLDLSLDVIQRGSTSLHACLTSYFRPESIDGLILCSQCNIGRPAVKQFSLLHLPNVLCFYLKRCHHDTKINTSIAFPADLDLAPYLHQIDGEQSAWQDRYSLYAVLNHSGQTNSGHYTAYIRSGPGSWCLCDDQKIVAVSLEHVLQTDAYVLLYHKNLLAMRA
ncbi:Ubiquitin carboxyl terminal hydrolase 22 [Fasciolopsis buskii]|uniref:Ubiquitin carboxyl-terminal hydrolase n=1 Tax=Fasciolopsis buskii TaxID=27845 RepID=A0A8E0S3J0_9TREM|nr:Ubiquitin carboxyl terminal hydrolase 22 [Fasciolopsis buski]